MAIPIEGFTVVAKVERVQYLLADNQLTVPNATALSDDSLWRCSFMAESDARRFLQELEALGLNVTQGPDSDAVLADEFQRSVDPYCEWLDLAVWEKAVIAWKQGTSPDTVTAREGWDPKVGSGLQFHDPSSMKSLQFLRLEENVEVYLNTKTRQEVYIGRTSTPVDALFKTGSDIVLKHFVTSGEPALTGAAAQEVSEAAGILEKVIAEVPNWWNAQWFYGKSQLALGNYEAAYTAFRRAYEMEQNVEAVFRELAGVCLELQKFEEAVTIAERGVALEPRNAELIGNLAIALLMAGRLGPARKAIDAATKLAPDDQINQTIARILSELEEGRRDQPASLRDLSKPARPAKARAFKLPWRKG